jgi:hypothetical protein
MGYYLRYFGDGTAPDIASISRGVEEIDPNVLFGRRNSAVAEPRGALLWYRTAEQEPALIGQIEVNLPDDGIFEEEIEEFVELAEAGTGNRQAIQQFLQQCTFIVAIECLFGDRNTNDVLDEIGPILHWLSTNFDGFSQADGEGFYRGEELVLATK